MRTRYRLPSLALEIVMILVALVFIFPIYILVTLALNEDEIVMKELVDDVDVTALFLTAAAAVPSLRDAALAQRAGIAMFSMLTALAGADLGGYGRPIGPAGLDPAYAEQLALFTAGGLEARGA